MSDENEEYDQEEEQATPAQQIEGLRLQAHIESMKTKRAELWASPEVVKLLRETSTKLLDLGTSTN